MDELDEITLVELALWHLRNRDSVWSANLGRFSRSSPESNYRWWQLAKIQAERGVPAMQILVLEVLKLKLLR